jgi:hypothetical protein
MACLVAVSFQEGSGSPIGTEAAGAIDAAGASGATGAAGEQARAQTKESTTQTDSFISSSLINPRFCLVQIY